MELPITSESIVMRLAEAWERHKKDEFTIYLRDTFKYSCSGSPRFDCIYIAQMENGDLDSGHIGGILLQWWIVDDDGVRKTSSPKLPNLLNKPENLRARFYPRPVLRFYWENDRIVIGESFGPYCVCRKTAYLRLAGGILRFSDERVVWNACGE
jgi:hypothetical protein